MANGYENFELFCHVGLGKTGSTYLQYKFFPKLEGICYIQRTRYRRFERIIRRKGEGRYLVSREFDRQFEREVKKIAGRYPDAHIIIILRRNDYWIASQYRRYVKNGGQRPFEEFVDTEHDRGIWKLSDIAFYPKLEMIRDLFGNSPLVLFHDELKQEPYAFFDKIATYLGAAYNRDRIDIHPAHRSYSEKQLKMLRKIGGILFRKERTGSNNRMIHYIRFRSRWLLCHFILYTASLLPKKFAGPEPLIPPSRLEMVRQYFDSDWQQCLEFAGKYGYTMGKQENDYGMTT